MLDDIDVIEYDTTGFISSIVVFPDGSKVTR